MAENDKLDIVLSDPSLTSQDLFELAEVLGVGKKLTFTGEKARILLNEELRHAYGNSVTNPLRNSFEPDYYDIIRGVAKKLKLHFEKETTTEEIEELILAGLIEKARAYIIKEKGQQEWDKIIEQTEEYIQEAINEGKINAHEAAKLKTMSGAAMVSALIAGRLAGFALFMVVNQIFFAIARTLGLSIGVAVAGPIIGKTLAFLLGPAGWLIAGLAIVWEIGGPNWKKVIPAVVMVAIYRRKIQYGM